MDVTILVYTLDVADIQKLLLVTKRTVIPVDYKRKTNLSMQNLKIWIKLMKVQTLNSKENSE